MTIINTNNNVIQIRIYKKGIIINTLELVPNLHYQILNGDKITCHEENWINKYLFKRDKYYNCSFKEIPLSLKSGSEAIIKINFNNK
jgi:hypothetical protein